MELKAKQICCCVDNDNDEALYAMDENGDVYRYRQALPEVNDTNIRWNKAHPRGWVRINMDIVN